jgi:cell division protein FtsB
MSISELTKLARRYWRHYGTMNNIVIGVALLIAAGWAWGSVTTMQRNFSLQKEVDAKRRQLELTDLEVQTLQYQQNYYKSDEYKDLSAREHLGLASPGEKVLFLPPNSAAVKREAQQQAAATNTVIATHPEPGSAPSNLEQWINFFSGVSAQELQK